VKPWDLQLHDSFIRHFDTRQPKGAGHACDALGITTEDTFGRSLAHCAANDSAFTLEKFLALGTLSEEQATAFHNGQPVRPFLPQSFVGHTTECVNNIDVLLHHQEPKRRDGTPFVDSHRAPRGENFGPVESSSTVPSSPRMSVTRVNNQPTPRVMPSNAQPAAPVRSSNKHSGPTPSASAAPPPSTEEPWTYFELPRAKPGKYAWIPDKYRVGGWRDNHDGILGVEAPQSAFSYYRDFFKFHHEWKAMEAKLEKPVEEDYDSDGYIDDTVAHKYR
jgi:hypothetical protein